MMTGASGLFSQTTIGPRRYPTTGLVLVDATALENKAFGRTRTPRFQISAGIEEDDDWGVWPIQPDHYRAPEVILGNGWQMPADIVDRGYAEIALCLRSYPTTGLVLVDATALENKASVHPIQRSSKGINSCESTHGRNLSDEKTIDYART
jgi:hypothetical protein